MTRYLYALLAMGWLLVGAGLSLLFNAWGVEVVFCGVLSIAAGPGLLPAWRLAWLGRLTWEARARQKAEAGKEREGWTFPGD